MNNNYVPLEPSFSQQLGITMPTFNAGTASVADSFSFLFTLGIMVIVVTGAGVLAYAGWERIQPSEQAVSKSNKIAKRAVLGTLGVVCLYVLIKTFNADLVTGDVGLEALRNGSVQTLPVSGTSNTSASPTTCSNVQSVISSLTGGGICSGVTCGALTGCNYQQYMPMIESEAAHAGINKNIIIALMCKESKANKNAQNKNADGTYDCGLMQVNQKGICDASSLDITTNIRKGVAIYKRASLASRQVYQNIPSIAGTFASYNCCSNSTKPNAPSEDCTQANGFPYTIPKWACPINPGTSASNMCAVKGYACELTACVNQLGG